MGNQQRGELEEATQAEVDEAIDDAERDEEELLIGS